MPQAFFIVPMVGTGTLEDPIRAKYSDALQVVRQGAIRYSRTSVAVMLIDAPQTYLDFVEAQLDATFIVAQVDLGANLGGQNANRIKNALEAVNVPSNWLAASDNGTEALRGTIGMFLFSQRHEGLNDSGFFEDLEAAGFGLNTQWQNLSQAFRDTIQATIDDHGWGLNPDPNEQVRNLLKQFSDQFTSTEFFIGGVQV